jgi:hypothetical protein
MRKIAVSHASIISLDISQPLSDLQMQLESSFLGMTKKYWLGNVDAVSKSAIEEWKNYLHTYQGPNCLLYASAEAPKKDASQRYRVIDIPDALHKKEFIELFSFFVKVPAKTDSSRIDALYAKTDAISLDNASLLLYYLQVMGAQASEFFDHWLDHIVIPQKSLFNLSQHLFARQEKPFLNYWSAIKNNYPEQFWISFWSEQLWRAAFYCKYMQQSKIIEAKNIGQRLPFSFLQKDYKKHSFNELYKAHQTLYDLDYGLKHGASSIGLDLFLYNFFAKIYS